MKTPRGRLRPRRRQALAGLLALGFALASAAQIVDERPTQVLGNWLTEGRDGIIQISRAADGSYQGRIVGGNDPGRRNDKDPDASRRSLTLRGLVIMRGLKYDGDGTWSGGTIYDPDSGRTYRCNLELLDGNRLRLHGYIGFALLGRSQVWTRYLGESMDLPAASP